MPAKTRFARDAAVAGVLIAVAVLALLLRRDQPGRPERQQPRWAAEPGIVKTPVLDRPPRVLPGPRVAVGSPPREPRLPDEKEPREPPEEDPAVALARAQAEDRRWQELATREAEALHRYALLLPGDDAEVFTFLVRKLAWASELGLNRPENLEGLFFNRVFFAAGRWGEQPALPRAWVYLLRAAGAELSPGAEHAVARLADELFQHGYGETRAIETDVFGAPLEGGDPEYWNARGYPSIAYCETAWDLRNDHCAELYQEFIQRLGSILPPNGYQALREFLDLFNLAT